VVTARLAPERAGNVYDASLRGLIQATQMAFIPVAEGFGPTAPQLPRKPCYFTQRRHAADLRMSGLVQLQIAD